jgi:hypothetical protein
MTPVPYTYIRNRLKEGMVIPFLGAGASFGSRDPKMVPFRRPREGQPNKWDVLYFPTASELANCLADELDFPVGESRELTKVAQYYSAVTGRVPLRTALQEIFALLQDPSPIHRYLAEVAKESPLLVVTTNYDDLIERAFADAAAQFDLVVHAAEGAPTGEILWRQHEAGKLLPFLAKDLDIDLSKVSVIYKIHGTASREGQNDAQFVITEDDYIDFLSRLARNSAIPPIFAEPFQQRHFLFLGYGLQDWNLRVVLNRIEREMRRPGEIASWAIEAQPKGLERQLWQHRGVTVYDWIAMDEFAAGLRGQTNSGGPV